MRNKHFDRYTVILLLIWTGAVYSYGQSVSEVAVENELVSLEYEMSTPTVSVTQIQTFQLRAQQKLFDFLEIISLASIDGSDLDLKKELAHAALGLFYKDKVSINWYFFESDKNEELPLEDFLEKIIADRKKITVTAKKIRNEHILHCPPPHCAWEIFFQISQTNETGTINISEAKMDVVLKLEEKRIGSEEKEFWKVFLGDIKQIETRP